MGENPEQRQACPDRRVAVAERWPTLAERARLAATVTGRTGDGSFPFSHPKYPYGAWLTEAKQKAADAAASIVHVNPFTPGKAGGLAIWETAAAPSPWDEFRHMSPNKVPGFRKTNTTWLNETMQSFYRIGTLVDGATVRRPASPAVVDLMSNPWGWKLLEAAHALAHRTEVQRIFRPQGMGLYGSLTVNWVAKLCTAIQYNLPVDVSGNLPPSTVDEAVKSGDGFYRYGISLCDSNSFHSPFIRVPCIGKRAPVPDRDVAFLAVGVYIEPHPRGFSEGTGRWMEVNRWSCSPTMVSIAGWELVDVVMRQQPSVGYPGSKPEFVVAAPALMPYDSLGEFIESAKEARGAASADGDRYWHVLDWLDSRQCKDLVASSPTLPCKDCLRLNMHAEGAPGKPQSRPPKERINPKSKYLTREQREWLDWDMRLDKVFGIIEKAVIYYESRLYGHTEATRRRRERRHSATMRKAIMRKLETLNNKAQKAMKGGKPSLGAALLAEAGKLQAQLGNGILRA